MHKCVGVGGVCCVSEVFSLPTKMEQLETSKSGTTEDGLIRKWWQFAYQSTVVRNAVMLWIWMLV